MDTHTMNSERDKDEGLRPCPKCESTNVYSFHGDDMIASGVRCNVCGYEVMAQRGLWPDAITLWNDRK